MSEERVRQLLRRDAARQWRSTPDLWPSVRRRVVQGLEPDTHQTIRGRSWPVELAKMAAGAAVVALVAVVLGAIYSGQQANLPGVGEEGPVPSGGEIVTEGETLITRWNDDLQGRELLSVDAETGEPADRFAPVFLGTSGMDTPVGISPDGRTLAAISADQSIDRPYAGGTQVWPRANRLTMVDTATGEARTHSLPDDGWVPLSPSPQFSPDGETLALVYERDDGATVMLFDAATAELISEHSLGGRLGFLAFHPDGEELVAYSQTIAVEPGASRPEPPRVTLLDAATLDPIRSETLGGITSGWWCSDNCDAPLGEREVAGWNPGIVMGPDGEYLYVAHVDQPVIEQIGLRDGSVNVIGYEITPDKPDEVESRSGSGGYAMARIAAGGDNIYLLFGGADAFTIGFVELNLAEQDATVRSSGNAPDTGIPADWMELAPDRPGVFLAGRESVIRYDADQDGFEERFSDWTVHPSFTLDGEPILLAIQREGDETALGVVDPVSLEVEESWSSDDRTQWAGLPTWDRLVDE